MCGALTFFSAAICFFAGVCFGIIVAVLVAVAHREDRNEQDKLH